MTKAEAVMLAGQILGRYPSSRADEAVLAVWGEELAERFTSERYPEVLRLARDWCRRNPRTWAPSVDELGNWVRGRLEAAAKDRGRLPEPAPSAEELARNRERLRRLAAGIGGH